MSLLPTVLICVCVDVLSLQAVHHSPPVSSVVLLLPLRQPPDQLEDGALGQRRVPVGRPADELEVLHQAVAVLWLGTDHTSVGLLLVRQVYGRRPSPDGHKPLSLTQSTSRLAFLN